MLTSVETIRCTVPFGLPTAEIIDPKEEGVPNLLIASKTAKVPAADAMTWLRVKLFLYCIAELN